MGIGQIWRARSFQQYFHQLRRFRRLCQTRHLIDPLEPRTLLAAFAESDIVLAFESGMAAMRDESAAIARQGLGVDVPLLRENFADGVKAGEKIRQPFQLDELQTKSLDALRTLLDRNRFVYTVSAAPDAQGNLVRATKVFASSPSGSFHVGGSTGFSYFDGAATGELQGTVPILDGTFRVTVAFGVDVVDGIPTFYLGDTTALEATGIHAAGQGRGRIKLGSLVDVRVTGDADLTASASLSLNDPDGDHRIRTDDLAAPQSVVLGHVDGSVKFKNVNLEAKLASLDPIVWNTAFERRIRDSVVQPEEAEQINPPEPAAVLNSIAQGLMRTVDKIPFVGQLGSFLNRSVAIIEDSVGNLLPMDSIREKLHWLTDPSKRPSISGDINELRRKLSDLGIEVNVTASSVQQLVRGERVDLITFHPKGQTDFPLYHRDFHKDLLTYGIPGLASAQLTASFVLDASWGYTVGLGIDTAGFWIEPGTGIHVSAKALGSIEGSVKIFGAKLASATGGAGVEITGTVGIGDPTPGDNKVYLYEIFHDGQNLFQELLDSIDAQLKGTATLSVNARVKIGPIKKSWGRSKQWTLFDLHHPPKWVEPEPAAIPVLPVAPQPDGSLLISGTAENDHVLLTADDSTGTVAVQWVTGRGADGKDVWSAPRRFNTPTSVRFDGGEGDDRLDVAGAFPVRVAADGGAGDDTLNGGDAGDSLTGGAGDDKLYGGSGDDTIVGGDGDDSAWGGAGADTATGDAGINDLHGGDGADTLTGGPLADVLEGDADGDRIAGAAGPDDIRGGDGNDNIDGGADDDAIDAGAGNDVVNGGDGDDTILGADGDNRLFGGAGNDNIYSEDGRDYLLGQDGDDVLVAGGGDNLLLSGGPGNDRLYAEDGKDALDGGPGDDTLAAGPNDDSLVGGTGNDYLAAGTGVNTVRGDAGDDTVELRFDPATSIPQDRITGGTDRDTLLIVGTAGDDDLGLDQLYAIGYRATRRTRGSAAAPDMLFVTLPADMEVLAIDAGDGNDLIRLSPLVRKDLVLDGNTGDDIIYGALGRDTIFGDEGNDVLFGGRGSDEIHGGEGDDVIEAGPGSDVLYGDQGNDTLHGWDGRDIQYGGDGNDALDSGPGTEGDILYGQEGDDTILGNDGADVVFGGAGADRVSGGGLGDVIVAGDGDDVVAGGAGRDVIIGGAGNDQLAAKDFLSIADSPADQFEWYPEYLRLSQREVSLSAQLDELDRAIKAKNLAEVIRVLHEKEGREGLSDVEKTRLDNAESESKQDELAAEALSNEIQLIIDMKADLLPYSTVHVDQIQGEEGDDEIFGSANADFLSGGTGDDTIHHSAGDDTVQGEGGQDSYLVDGTDAAENIVIRYVSTPELPDAVYIAIGTKARVRVDLPGIEVAGVRAMGGDDTVSFDFGQKAYMKVFADGGAGNDRLDATGFQAGTTLRGGAGDDALIGGLSVDSIDGGDGNDLLHYSEAVGQEAPDSYNGGPGEDRLVISGTSADDQITLSGVTLTVNGVNHSMPAGAVEAFEVHGGPGNDQIENGFTPSVLTVYFYGDDGNDVLTSRAGTSELYGGDGDDDLAVTSGTHRLAGGPGMNRLHVIGQDNDERFDLTQVGLTMLIAGAVIVTADQTQDVLFQLGGGNDYLDASGLRTGLRAEGGDGNDTIIAGPGDDFLIGGHGDDRLEGNDGNDRLDGGDGANSLFGGRNEDKLITGPANLINDGGEGYDWLVHQPGPGTTVIYSNAYVDNGTAMTNPQSNVEAIDVETQGMPVTTLRGAGAGADTRFGLYGGPILVNGVEIAAAEYRAAVRFDTTTYVHQYSDRGPSYFDSGTSEADGDWVGEQSGREGAVAAMKLDLPTYVGNLGLRYWGSYRAQTSGGDTWFHGNLDPVSNGQWLGGRIDPNSHQWTGNPPSPWPHWALWGFNIALTGAEAANYNVEYRARMGRNYVLTPVARNGELCGGLGGYDGGTNGGRDHESNEVRLIWIRVVPKNAVTVTGTEGDGWVGIELPAASPDKGAAPANAPSPLAPRSTALAAVSLRQRRSLIEQLLPSWRAFSTRVLDG